MSLKHNCILIATLKRPVFVYYKISRNPRNLPLGMRSSELVKITSTLPGEKAIHVVSSHVGASDHKRLGLCRVLVFHFLVLSGWFYGIKLLFLCLKID